MTRSPAKTLDNVINYNKLCNKYSILLFYTKSCCLLAGLHIAGITSLFKMICMKSWELSDSNDSDV